MTNQEQAIETALDSYRANMMPVIADLEAQLAALKEERDGYGREVSRLTERVEWQSNELARVTDKLGHSEIGAVMEERRRAEQAEFALEALRIEVAGYAHVTNHIRQLTGDYESADIDFTVGRLLRERQTAEQRIADLEQAQEIRVKALREVNQRAESLATELAAAIQRIEELTVDLTAATDGPTVDEWMEWLNDANQRGDCAGEIFALDDRWNNTDWSNGEEYRRAYSAIRARYDAISEARREEAPNG